MGLFDGLFGDGISGILGGFGQQNMNDQMRIQMQQSQAAQQQYYEQLKQYSSSQLQQEIDKAKRKKFDYDEADIIDAEFEIITEVKSLPEPE